MTPERMAELVSRWVRFYTRNLPAPIADRRVGEIDADLHDHIAHGRAHGTGDRRIALAILSRMVRGMPADASWRGHHAKTTDHPSTRENAMKTRPAVYRSAVRVALATASILAVLFVTMAISGDVAWTGSDFVLAGVLLTVIGVALEAAWRARTSAYRAGVAVAVVGALMLVWAIGAVGVVGAEGDRFDMIYLGVLAVGIVGAVVARLRPGGMARALFATALAQAAVAVTALVVGEHEAAVTSVAEILGVNAIFVALFAASAYLFQQAARRQPPPARRQTAG